MVLTVAIVVAVVAPAGGFIYLFFSMVVAGSG